MARVAVLVGVLVLAIMLLPAVAASRPEGPVAIVTAIDFSSVPFHGTFGVASGSSVLGCSGGTFVDTPIAAGGAIKKAFTCTSGPAAGDTFTYLIHTAADAFSEGNAKGAWEVFEGTGFFATLRGQGAFSLQITSPTSGVETLTGMVHFE